MSILSMAKLSLILTVALTNLRTKLLLAILASSPMGALRRLLLFLFRPVSQGAQIWQSLRGQGSGTVLGGPGYLLST